MSKPRRLQPEKAGSPDYRQIWRIVDGAVLQALTDHPEYLARHVNARTVRNSIVKRVAGAITGYADQSAWVRSGSSPANVTTASDLSLAVGALVTGASKAGAATLQPAGEGVEPSSAPCGVLS